MNYIRNISYGSSLILLTACATYNDWKPTIDPYNDPHVNRIEHDLGECKQLSLKLLGMVPWRVLRALLWVAY